MSFTYDARIVPSQGLEYASSLLSSAIDLTAKHIVGSNLDHDGLRQIQLAGAFGGCGVRKTGSGGYADAAFFAAWTGRSIGAAKVAAALGRPLLKIAGASSMLLAKQKPA